ncbi:MAG: hypothetical protein AAF485_28960 [Chloroflexota bacterium]
MPYREPSSDDPHFDGRAPSNNVVIDIKVIANWIQELTKSKRLWWRLFTSNQVPTWTKIIPVLSIIYWLSPFDFALIPIIGNTSVRQQFDLRQL